jgi:hypothetical protein
MSIYIYSGQVEKRMSDGTVEVLFPDGTVAQTFINGDKILSLPNGQREIHTKEYKVNKCLSSYTSYISNILF